MEGQHWSQAALGGKAVWLRSRRKRCFEKPTQELGIGMNLILAIYHDRLICILGDFDMIPAGCWQLYDDCIVAFSNQHFVTTRLDGGVVMIPLEEK